LETGEIENGTRALLPEPQEFRARPRSQAIGLAAASKCVDVFDNSCSLFLVHAIMIIVIVHFSCHRRKQ